MRLFALIFATALLSFSQSNIVRIPLGEDPAAIMRATGAGATFEFEAGVHRVDRLPIESGDTLFSDGGAVLSGADTFAWSDLGDNTYSIAWPYNWGLWSIPANWPAMTDTVRRREVLWVNGVRLRQILTCSALGMEQYCVDEIADTITFRTARPIEAVEAVEAAVRSQLIAVGNVSNVTIRGLTFTGTASNYDSSAVTFVSSQSITVENSRFEENNGGGLGIISSQNIITRNNVYSNNGGTGYGASRIIGLSAENEVANGNNWRGGLGGFVNWSAAGIKHLYLRNAVYSNITTNDNQTHGTWFDTDVQGASVIGLKSSGNLKYGLFLEALTGHVSVSASTLANNQIGIFSGNTANVSLNDITLTDNQTGILIGGDPTRPVKDFVTGANYSVPPAANWKLSRVNITGKGAAFRHGTGAFDAYRTTLSADFNNFWKASSTFPIEILSEKLTLDQWRARVNQDANSTSLQDTDIPFTPTPTNTAVITNTFTPTNTIVISATFEPTQTPLSVTVTPVISATAQPTTNAETATPTPEITQTPTDEWVLLGIFRITIRVEQLATPE